DHPWSERTQSADRRLCARARLANLRAHRELGVPWLFPRARNPDDRVVPIRTGGSTAMSAATAVVARPKHERVDRWWVQPLLVVVVLGGFSIYALWAALQNGNYFAEPYLSPFYSPCLAQNCVHPTIPILGQWWNLTPAFLVLWVPLGFRATCYYYRRA